MKKILFIVSLAVGCFAAAAEAPVTYRVDNLGNAYEVRADGSEVNLGKPYDAMANHLASKPALAAGIQQAAETALADFKAAQAADKAAALATLTAQKDAERNAAVDAKDAALAAAQASIATLQAAANRAAALEQYIAALNVYIAGLRGQLAGLGAQSSPPPAAP
jgi:hypothetical protein